MSYEIDGILIILALSFFVLWFATSLWSVIDSRRRKEGAGRMLLGIVPLAGPLIRYLSLGEGTKSAKIITLLKKRWPIIALIIILSLSMFVRLNQYHWTYLRNIDSYTFYRQIDEISLNNGVLPEWDNLVMAPYGIPRLTGLQPYVYLGAYSFMLVKLFFANITLIQFLIYFPALLASLAAIPVYFIGKMLYDNKAGVFAAFIYTFSVDNLSRTLGGDPDSDAIIFVTSMITIAVMIFIYKYSVKESTFSKKFILYSVLAGIVVWVWFNSWAGYWYVFWLFTGLVLARLIFDIIESRSLSGGVKKSKFVISSYAIYMVIAFLLAAISFNSTAIITDALAGPIQFQSIKGEDAQFPNVYVSVAELQQGGGVGDVIARTSILSGAGILISPFFLFIYAMIYLLYSYYKKREHIDTLLLLLIWFFGPLTATVIAIRFSVLFSAPLAIGSGIFLSKIIRLASGEDKGAGE